MSLLPAGPATPAPQEAHAYSILHFHQAAETNPKAALVADGAGNLYGTTAGGGLFDKGTVFTVRADGTGFRRLHDFAGGLSDGSDPEAALFYDGRSTLYGTTVIGGSSSAGTIFRIDVSGEGFRVLHAFAGGFTDGAYPSAALVADDAGNLYGTTSFGFGTTSLGGSGTDGSVFRIGSDGSGYQVLHVFTGGVAGRIPRASVILDGAGNLFGTTAAGGQPGVWTEAGYFADGYGTVFRMRTDGTGFQILHAFPQDLQAGGGLIPSGALVRDGSGRLYGGTLGGGLIPFGAIYALQPDGTGFTLLHSGIGVSGSLTLDGSGSLYGAATGALLDAGTTTTISTIFSIRTNGNDFRILHSFTDATQGSSPTGSLVLDASGILFGSMTYGGAANAGTIFKINSDGTGFNVVLNMAGAQGDGLRPRASLVQDTSGNLYGTTGSGGPSGAGTVFSLRQDGSGYRVLHAFTGADGSSPWAPLVLDASGYLYGTTGYGGLLMRGVVFRLRTDGTGFEVLRRFEGAPSDGASPLSSLTLDASGNLYGTTLHGGASDFGVVFRMRTDGSNWQVLHSFSLSADDGVGAIFPLVLDGAGNLFGTTEDGGARGRGTVFKLRTDGSGFALLHSFFEDCLSCATGGLVLDRSGNLYGTAAAGPYNSGTVFSLRTDGSDYRILHEFAGIAGDAVWPASPLVLDDSGSLYGTSAGGEWQRGTVFTIKTDGTRYEILHSFGGDPEDGADPTSSLLLDRSGMLFGTTSAGGLAGNGTEFALASGQHKPVTAAPSEPARRR